MPSPQSIENAFGNGVEKIANTAAAHSVLSP
jgi:hypothetical protein